MKLGIFICVASFFLPLASSASGRQSRREKEALDKKFSSAMRQPSPRGRELGKNDCGSCDSDVFYHYESASSSEYWHGVFTKTPSDCVLAAISDDESRRGAQYAIPPGKIAATQGIFPIDRYIKDCHFDGEKTMMGNVTGCDNDYSVYFDNVDGSTVPDDTDCWVNISFPIPAGALYAALGSDGLLRPVKGYSTDTEDFGIDGAVYECCPDIRDVCNVEPEEKA